MAPGPGSVPWVLGRAWAGRAPLAEAVSVAAATSRPTPQMALSTAASSARASLWETAKMKGKLGHGGAHMGGT